MGFFGRLWRGEYSLPRTYWLFGVLVGIAYNIFSTIVLFATGEISVAFFMAIIYLPYYVTLTGGVWRSANIYCHTEGKTALWGRLAQVAVVLGWLLTLGNLGQLAQVM